MLDGGQEEEEATDRLPLQVGCGVMTLGAAHFAQRVCALTCVIVQVQEWGWLLQLAHEVPSGAAHEATLRVLAHPDVGP